MALVNLTDEVSYTTAKVYTSKAVRVASPFTYIILPSGTATGSITTSPGILHSITFGASAAGSKFWIFDNADSATAGIIGASAGAIARIEGGTARTTLLFDILFNSGMLYRLSAADHDGITISYSVAS